MRKTALVPLFGLLFLRAGALGQSGGPGTSTHVTWSEESCMKCHDTKASTEIRDRLTKPCSEMCATCHTFTEKHHPVGVPISGRLTAPLVLTRKATNTCVTCHDVTRPRFEGAPWVSQSLFARATRRSRENRTFYLAMRNDRGQLCRNCH